MTLDVIFKINKDDNLHRYLRENSYWYKLLNRDPKLISKMESDMKKAYKLTLEDKVSDLTTKINLIKGFLDASK
ncbi:MAG: YlbE-like family protein [Bacilli bacterium]|nr:YlbE-like family protein [Bacilli bacterium]